MADKPTDSGTPENSSQPADNVLDFTSDKPVESPKPPVILSAPYPIESVREEARGDLARGLLYLLTFAIGGVLTFVGLGRLDGTVITQSIFPSLIALAGTALGFYFGSQSGKGADGGSSGSGGAAQGSGLTAASNPRSPSTSSPENGNTP